jgi:hypothetical protein
VEERLPFELLGFDSDNGGEFLNRNRPAAPYGVATASGS